jgi:hypothetical protein
MASLTDIAISRGPTPEVGFAPESKEFDPEPIPATLPAAPAGDERRGNVRAYNRWLALAECGEIPGAELLSPARMEDFWDCAVVVDLTQTSRPSFAHIGAALRSEWDQDREVFALADVPRASLLSRLSEHCLEVVNNRAPVGFDAEFVGKSGANVLYRSILLPFSSDGQTVDFVFGVIGWKEAGAPP